MPTAQRANIAVWLGYIGNNTREHTSGACIPKTIVNICATEPTMQTETSIGAMMKATTRTTIDWAFAFVLAIALVTCVAMLAGMIVGFANSYVLPKNQWQCVSVVADREAKSTRFHCVKLIKRGAQ